MKLIPNAGKSKVGIHQKFIIDFFHFFFLYLVLIITDDLLILTMS